MTAPPPYEEYSDHFSPLQVEIDGSFEDGLKHFKSLVQRSKILTLFKEKQTYEKPSARRRRKKHDREERNRLAMMRDKSPSNELDYKSKDVRRFKNEEYD